MSTPATLTKSKWITLKSVAIAPPGEAFLLPTSGFPAKDEEVALLREFLEAFTAIAGRIHRVTGQGFLQVWNVEGIAKKFARYGAEWGLHLGLGVWPDRQPPTLWSRADFEDLDVGEWPRPLMYRVQRVSAGSRAWDSARNEMAGSGSVLQIMSAEAPEAYLERAKSTLLPHITEKALRSFPFYVPLLEGRAVEDAQPDQVAQWLQGALIYVRESREDKGVLIVSSKPLAEVFRGLGGEMGPGAEPAWRLPV